MSQTRIADRAPVAAPGLIASAGAPIACTIEDLSSFGARLSVDCADAVPDSFVLRASCLAGLQICRVAWRGEGMLGTWFDRAADC